MNKFQTNHLQYLNTLSKATYDVKKLKDNPEFVQQPAQEQAGISNAVCIMQMRLENGIKAFENPLHTKK